ncbi:exported hypothetical protein [Verrucomicrobia bacterium]|nr:exported hypothetical protein [Verrucomicrobiota bacterium]
MNNHQKLTAFCLTVLALAASFSARAQGITNNFTTSADYVANGIVGDTNWDGVYLGFGDVPNGSSTSGLGASSVASANLVFPGDLTLTSTGGAWAGAGDDGFFLWKLVTGDFDVAVESLPNWDTTGNNFGGLLVRAYATNNSGAPFSTTSTNAAENFVELWRGQEFSIDQVRIATNGADVQDSFTDALANTNQTRFFRIVRSQSTNFMFFWKTNYGDGWVQLTNAANYPNGIYVRSDFANLPLQVGIDHALFSGNQATVFFTDFELKGPNVNPPPAMPPAPANVTVSPLNCNSVGLSWTTNGGSGSLVVVRANGILLGNPVQGQTYTGDTNFQDPNTLLSSSRSHIVYAGPATNITVTGLGGSNNTYNVYVFSYSGSGPTIAYNTASPASTNFVGPGTVTNVSFTVSPANLPAGGVGSATITAHFCDGESVNVSSDPNATLTSSDPTIITINSGVMNALANGTASITAGYAGYLATNSVSVHTPAFTDNFSTTHNYLTQGLPGTGWEGGYFQYGDFPGETTGVGAMTTDCDANNTTPGVLTVTAQNTAWAGAGDNGFFLHKYVQGDFQMAVHVTIATPVNYEFAGLMARAYNNSGVAGKQGAAYSPDGTTPAENWVYFGEFEEFGDSLESRYALDGADNELANFDAATGPFWMLMTRVNSTNFLFYRKVNLTDPWTPEPQQTILRPDFIIPNGQPGGTPVGLQAGLFQAMYTGNLGTVAFDSFMLDAPDLDAGGPPPSACSNLVETVNPDFSITLTWTPGTNADSSQATSFVVGREGAPVNQQPPYGFLSSASSTFGQGTDLGGGNFVLFRGVGNTVTVTGLAPGDTYYFAVYSYSSSGTTKVFDTETAAATPFPGLQDGNPTNIVSSLPVPSIPSFGVGFPVVNLVFPGNIVNPVNVARFSTMTSANTNIAVAGGGLITGISPGATSIQVVYTVGTNSFTNTLPVTVHAPAFTDSFTVAHDYLHNGAVGSPWDGVYAYPNFTVPGTGFTSDPAAQIFGADAGITANGTLTVSNENVGWEYNQNDGFFLFKYVPADFQMQVHLVNFNAYSNNLASAGSANYDNPGLMARLYTTYTNGNIGAPFATNANGTYGEDWVSWTRFDQFGIGTYARAEIDNAKVVSSTQPDIGSGQFWLLLVRQSGTNFSFYQRASQTDPWLPAPNGVTYANAVYANQPMQIGIIACAFDSGLEQVDQFDNFALDVSGGFGLTITLSGSNIILSWPDQPGVQVQTTASLPALPADWRPVLNPPPTVVNGVASLTLPIGAQNAYFRLSEPVP